MKIQTWLTCALLIGLHLLGIPIVVIVAQVFPQLVSTRNPQFWANLPGTRAMFNIALAFESIGVTHFGQLVTAAFLKAGNTCGCPHLERLGVGEQRDNANLTSFGRNSSGKCELQAELCVKFISSLEPPPPHAGGSRVRFRDCWLLVIGFCSWAVCPWCCMLRS